MRNRWNWDPFREMERMHDELHRYFGGNGEKWNAPFSRMAFLPGRAARAYPLTNVYEDEHGYYVEGLAPGVDPEKLKVSVVRNQLQISGEKKHVDEELKSDAWHRSERSAGNFTRTLTLPDEIDSDKVEANYENGILTIKLPKSETAKPKQISVNAS
ncbi:MAG: Hsp20/alpha crystallin family protein [Candidatus Sumerlaeia bacterium]